MVVGDCCQHSCLDPTRLLIGTTGQLLRQPSFDIYLNMKYLGLKVI